mgnify:CR=1 FL=1
MNGRPSGDLDLPVIDPRRETVVRNGGGDDIRARDLRDIGRAAAPLVMADDANLLDTSFLSIESAVQRAIELVEARVRAKTS